MSNQLVYRAFAVLCLMAVPALAGCNTVAGFGRDVAASGEWMAEGADNTQEAWFGESDQTAEGSMASPEAVAPSAGGNVAYFRTGSATLEPEAREMIRSAAALLGDGTATTLQVTGYADTLGPSDVNERLSQRRAEAVAAELAAEGVPRESIDVTWHGESELALQTGDNVSAAENRRVVVNVSSG